MPTNYNALIDALVDDDDFDLFNAHREMLMQLVADNHTDLDDLLTTYEIPLTEYDRLHHAMMLTLKLLDDDNREMLTEMLLSRSLCPLHAIDYAICFDDDDPECASIRLIHPDHDT